MTFKRITSILVMLTLVLGVLSPMSMVLHTHAQTQSIHTVAGELAYNTGKYYLYADVQTDSTGSKQFYYTGYTTQTTPNSLLGIRTEYSTASAITLIPNDASNPTGFQMGPSAQAGRIIVHYNKNSGTDLDTTEERNPSAEKSVFTWDSENGRICHRFQDKNYVLVAQNISSKWRMKFVPEAQASASGSYLVKIGELRTCDYRYVVEEDGHYTACSCGSMTEKVSHATQWECDEAQHWGECVCGYEVPKTDHSLALQGNETVHWSYCTQAGCGYEDTESQEVHDFSQWYYDENQHWQACACGQTQLTGEHSYVMDEVLGYEVCQCGADLRPHQCESADGKWYVEGENHYQLCECGERFNAAQHSLTAWNYDEINGTQSRACVCGYTQILYGTDNKVSQAAEPKAGESYYLAANVQGTVYFMIHGTVTATTPYSLAVTTDLSNADLRQVMLETPVSGDEGFQLAYLRPSDDKLLRIYCYDSGGSDGIMDTGVNTASTVANHTFYVDEVNGAKVLRKYGNNHILAVKYNSEKGQWRMLGVPESELENEGVYPAMLANVHSHSYDAGYDYDNSRHWTACDCGAAGAAENHNYVPDETLGYGVCVCGADQKPHACESADGKWYEGENGHYQLCGKCDAMINHAGHTYGDWSFDSEQGIQSRSCTLCGSAQTLYGTDNKVIPVETPVVGQSYYLAANAGGKVFFFRYGSATETTPYSLPVTDVLSHKWLRQVTLEAPVEGDKGFQLIFADPTQERDLRIYCYDVLTTGDNKGIMDTGFNAANYLNRHTFFVDEVNGVKVLRKIGNNNILVAKYDLSAGAWRMLGVPESELANEGVYPVMLADLHAHSFTDATYQSDSAGHWYPCECGGKSDYAKHTVANWEITKAPTETTPGSKTGVCTLCGATAIAEMPAALPEGHYYLTGKLDGVQYYFRNKTGKESVEHTVPFSLHTANGKKNAMQVNILWDEEENVYTISYFSGKQLNVYMGDVNGSTIQKDGQVDLGSSTTTAEALIHFRWDTESRTLYQMEGGVKYVLAFKKLTNTSTNQQEVRLMALPESELGADAVLVQLEVIHQHTYAQKWSYDAISHWHACSCGTRKDEAAHQVTQWNVEKKATASAPGRKSGVCVGCGEKITNAIPMIRDNVKAPVNGGKYYLTAVLNGVRYYFRHAPAGTSVTDTTPYSLYAVSGTDKVNALTVKVSSGNYNLTYGTSNYHIYINGNGVGVTSNASNKSLVDFQWDEENKLLYQVENNVKHVLVLKKLKDIKTGATVVRITSMPMEQALIDPTVSIAQLSTQAPSPSTEDKDGAVDSMPEGATPLDTIVPDDLSSENISGNIKPAIRFDYIGSVDDTAKNLVLAAAVSVGILAVLLLLLLALRKSAFGAFFFRRWNLWSGACLLLAAVLLVGAMFLTGAAKNVPVALSEFTIVTDAENVTVANELAVTLYEKYGVSLPVVEREDYQGDRGIYLDMMGLNSYGGYKYSVCSRTSGENLGIFINGSGISLDTAIGKWLKSIDDPYAFPFGLQEQLSGYEWNTGDINMTGLGFALTESESTALYDGVELRKLKYESFGYGKVTGYAVIVAADAQVELKVAAADWNETHNAENPAPKHTVEQYGKMLTEEGYEVLAITNAGFYDLNETKTNIPLGMQVVDGYVKQVPSEINPRNTDNWFAQTADGKYVISNTAGYYETYETTLAQGVGGGMVLMKNGVPCFSSTSVDYRTVVGITKAGDLIMLTMPGANYAVIAQIFMDMDMDVETVLNLDGGGSTTLHTLDESGKLTRFLCETPVEREVADAIAIVKKK